MARKTYRLDELVAGKTIFMSRVNWVSPEPRPVVLEYLIGSECDRVPDRGEIQPYRVRPSDARRRFGYVGEGRDMFKTRRAARRDAEAYASYLKNLRPGKSA